MKRMRSFGGTITIMPLLAVLTVTFAMATGAAGAEGTKSAGKKNLGPKRGLASLPSRSVTRMGQGETMLYSVQETSPTFLKDRDPANKHVRLAGVCRDANGLFFNSAEKGYAGCLESQGSRTGEFNSYQGAAQRQAGLGILVGK